MPAASARQLALIIAPAILVLSLASTDRVPGQADESEAKTTTPVIFRTATGTLEALDHPVASSFDESGNLYVVERWTARVLVVRWDTQSALRSFGGPGEAQSRFHDPHDIAIDDGTVAVADTGNHRVQLFGVDGSFRRSIDGGTDPLLAPRGVAIRGDRIAVADTGNHRVQLFDLDGDLVASLGEHGFGDGELLAPADVAIDAAGQIHVADTGNHRWVTFTADGRFVRATGGRGFAPGFFDLPTSITVYQDHVYLADSRNHRIQIFTRNGSPVGRWGVHAVRPHAGDGRLHYPTSVAFDPRAGAAENVQHTAVVSEPFEDRLQSFSDIADPDRPAPRSLPGNAPSDVHFGMRASQRGSLLAVVTEGESAVALYDLRGKTPVRVHDLGRYGTQPGELVAPTDVFLGPRKRIYLCDPIVRRIAVYEHEWSTEDKVRFRPRLSKFVRSIDTTEIQRANADLRKLPTLEFDVLDGEPSGELYLLDSRLGVIVVLDAELNVRRSFGGLGSQPGRFRSPTDLAIGPRGDLLYVVDSGHARVQALRADGAYAYSLGRRGDEPGEFSCPFGVATALDGTVYVSDVDRHHVSRFHANGRFASRWGGTTKRVAPVKRLEPSKLFKPAGLATNYRGDEVTVIDWGHHRGQISKAGAEPFRVFGSRFFLAPPRKSPGEENAPKKPTPQEPAPKG